MSDPARDRTEVHRGHASQRILSENHDGVGMAGEWAFGQLSGICPDLLTRVSGDGGVDFTVPLRFTVDVKTFRKPNNLIHEEGKPFADIFVLAGYDDDTGNALLIGWEWGNVLKRSKVREFGHGIRNHFIPCDELRPISDLAERMVLLK